jgi:hypothetical protein
MRRASSFQDRPIRLLKGAGRGGSESASCASASGFLSYCQSSRIHFQYPEFDTHSEQILLSREAHSNPRDDDREPITRARHAAEALFTSKPRISRASVPDTRPAKEAARKPRVLPVVSDHALPPPVSSSPVRTDVIKAAVRPELQTMPEIPRSHFERIRTWVKYGMTVPQVAEVYGTDVGRIERILRNT